MFSDFFISNFHIAKIVIFAFFLFKLPYFLPQSDERYQRDFETFHAFCGKKICTESLKLCPESLSV